MITAMIVALGACMFVLGVGLAIAVMAHQIRETAHEDGRPDHLFNLENGHEKD